MSYEEVRVLPQASRQSLGNQSSTINVALFLAPKRAGQNFATAVDDSVVSVSYDFCLPCWLNV